MSFKKGGFGGQRTYSFDKEQPYILYMLKKQKAYQLWMSSTSCETSIQHGTFEESASICNFIGANEKQVTHLSGHMGLALSLSGSISATHCSVFQLTLLDYSSVCLMLGRQCSVGTTHNSRDIQPTHLFSIPFSQKHDCGLFWCRYFQN